MVWAHRRSLIALLLAACGDDGNGEQHLDAMIVETCTTRVSYADTSMTFGAAVTWDGTCNSGSATLSNGTVIPSCATCGHDGKLSSNVQP